MKVSADTGYYFVGFPTIMTIILVVVSGLASSGFFLYKDQRTCGSMVVSIEGLHYFLVFPLV